MTKDAPSSSIVEKTILIMDTVHRSKSALRFSDIVAQTGLNKSSSHRILQILVAHGLLRYEDDQKTYDMGGRVLDWARRFLGEGNIRALAAPAMEMLAASTGQNVLMAIRDGADVVYVDRVDAMPTEPVVARVGARAPLQCTAIGKCLMAFASPATQEQILAAISWVAHTENSITDRGRLMADLARGRERGYTLDDREHQPNVHCIAAPILNVTGRTIAAISITANIFRVPREQLLGWTALLRATARDISTQLGADAAEADRVLRLGRDGGDGPPAGERTPTGDGAAAGEAAAGGSAGGDGAA